MRSFSFWLVVWLVVPLGLPAGCGTGPDDASPKKRSTVVGTQELPSLSDYLPPLDGGRIEFAPPKGWNVPPASSDYVVRVRKSAKENYPSIVVTAEDSEGIANVTAENVKEFAGQVAAAVEKDKSAVKPMIGKFVGVAYRKRAKVRKPVTRILEVLYLETAVAGRKYRIELRCEEGSLEKSQPYLFAVVEGIRFLEAGPDEKPEETAATKEEPEEEPQKDKEGAPEAKQGAKQEPKAGPKAEPKEKAKKKAKEEGGLELDLDKLDKLLK
ncbi:MAG TPA: hypothetical protein VMY37_10805 [Thermoguttaceae bacterium]|nr:hypothetical protein [Thermoguttaceae bacterium]